MTSSGGGALSFAVGQGAVSSSSPAPALCAAEEEFEDLCFEYGIELDDVVRQAGRETGGGGRAAAAAGSCGEALGPGGGWGRHG